MQRLTVAGRLLITALILAAIFFGFRYFGGNEALRKLAPNKTEEAESSTMPNAEDRTSPASPDESVASDDKSEASDAGSGQSRPAFTYTPPAPSSGKLRGVVELGASGFNSFIVKVDDQRKLETRKSRIWQQPGHGKHGLG